MTRLSAEILDKGPMTEREAEVFRLMCEGQTDKAIARALDISQKTVGVHLEHIYAKFELEKHGFNTRCAVIGRAVSRGMVRFSLHAVCWCVIGGMFGYSDQAYARQRHGRLVRHLVSHQRQVRSGYGHF